MRGCGAQLAASVRWEGVVSDAGQLGCGGRGGMELVWESRRDSSNLVPSAVAIVDGLVEVSQLENGADVVLDGPHVVVADRITQEKSTGLLPMYEVRVRVYAEESRKDGGSNGRRNRHHNHR